MSAAPSSAPGVAREEAARSCEAAWVATLAARGIVCDHARRERMRAAAPYLAQIRQRLREWRAHTGTFDTRVEAERHCGE